MTQALASYCEPALKDTSTHHDVSNTTLHAKQLNNACVKREKQQKLLKQIYIIHVDSYVGVTYIFKGTTTSITSYYVPI